MRPIIHDPDAVSRACVPHSIRLLILTATIVSCGGDIQDEKITELYRQGNAFYEREQYPEASRTYERIVQQGFHNGFVFYNLGNAHFKQNQIGRAILAYERAARLMPRDRDLQANLEIANQRTIDRLEKPDPWVGHRLLRSVTVNEVTAATSLLASLLFITGILFVLTDSSTFRRRLFQIGVVVGALFVLCGGTAAIRVYDEGRFEAIILSRECEARSGPANSKELLFSLHEGTKVSIVEKRGSWKRIALPDGNEGWVDGESLEEI
ncbi:MAG: tetratricopeptide repeat protein [Gemmatimonadota bacterium]|nr:tetratricopeptide repeat protein [Gemmatimonadota bacterium]